VKWKQLPRTISTCGTTIADRLAALTQGNFDEMQLRSQVTLLVLVLRRKRSAAPIKLNFQWSGRPRIRNPQQETSLKEQMRIRNSQQEAFDNSFASSPAIKNGLSVDELVQCRNCFAKKPRDLFTRKGQAEGVNRTCRLCLNRIEETRKLDSKVGGDTCFASTSPITPILHRSRPKDICWA
jgi:hypothetical protein